MKFVCDFLIEDSRMDMNHLEFPSQSISQQEAGEGITQPFNFSQTRHEDKY